MPAEIIIFLTRTFKIILHERMSYFDQNYLIRLLQDLDPTRFYLLFLSFLEDRITAASRYIGSFPNYAKESVNVLIYEFY